MPWLKRGLNIFLNPAGRWQLLAIALFHLIALGAVSRLAHWFYPLVVFKLVICLVPFWVYARLKHVPLKFTSAAWPLGLLYGVAVLRLGIALVMRVVCPACEPVPPPLADWLSYEWAILLSLSLVLLVQAEQTIPTAYQPRLAALALLSLCGVWVATLFPHLIPSGVTGADPFAYVQMGVDLAMHASPFHSFALADLARGLNLPIYPTLFVGYTIPTHLGSATVWPIGFSGLLAVAYKVLGEQGLYVLNPLLGLGSAFVTALMAQRVFKLSAFWSIVAAALLITSLEQTIRLSVPLADVAAQLFTILALLVALWPGKSSTSIWQFAICGALCALAFATRYTQLLIAPGVLVVLLWNWPKPDSATKKLYVRAILIFGLAFAVMAAPDFGYRTDAFGSPLAFAAGELGQFSASDILPVTGQLLADLARDLNLALPLALIGLVLFIRSNRRMALGLGLILGPAAIFHLPYHYLKLRDLLFLLPSLYALAAYGFAGLARRLQQTKWPLASFVLVHCSLFILLAFRFSAQLPMLSGYYTYGFLTEQGRTQIESIATLTEPQAVIAASLNSGAINLYAERDTFRPGHLLQPGRTWTDDELLTFANALHQQGRPLYLLADSEEMADPLLALRAHWRVTAIAELYLPYYYRDGSALNDLIPLYRLDPP